MIMMIMSHDYDDQDDLIIMIHRQEDYNHSQLKMKLLQIGQKISLKTAFHMDFKGQCETEIHYEKHKIEQKKGREIFHLNQKSIQSRLIIYWQFFIQICGFKMIMIMFMISKMID